MAGALLLSGVALAQTPGPNRNVVAGVVHPLDPDDPSAVIKADLLRQRQNEPVLAPSSTNPEHLIAAANDYRTVDIAGDIGTGESNDSFVSRAFARLASFVARLFGREPAKPARPVAAAEAWMGVYRSCDRGRTWFGSLVPGSPTDSSVASLASPLHGFQAASDPVLAPAPDGRAFLGGLVFTRGGMSAIFAARYTDRNDREGGACFSYDFTRVVETGTVSDTGRFADKPTITADVARPHPGPETRYVYMAYTIFTGNETDKNFRGRVRFVRSEDDGATWTNPVTVSGNLIHNQGAALAIDPVSGDVYIVWRDFIDDAVLMTRSHDFGATWADPVPIHPGLINAFDPATKPDQFRSNGFPTIAVDGNSRVFVAWQELVNLDTGLPDPAGSPRIVLTMSQSITNKGVTWTPRQAVDLRPHPQVMPALSASAGQLMLIYAEAAGDTFEGRNVELDVRVAELNPATGWLFPNRSSAQVSEYTWKADSGDPPALIETAPGYPAWHRPNLPMFRGGTVPFIGDYKFLVPAQPYVRTADGAWKWASASGDVGAPSFHAVWTDNRNVEFPGDNIDGAWNLYAPPGGGRASCINPGSRDQDIFTSEISNGIVAGTPSLFKPLLRPNGEPIQRAFVVYVENRTPDSRYVVLHLLAGDGTTASFDQSDPTQTTFPPAGDPDYDTMELFPHSTITRTVYLDNVSRADGSAQLEVREDQVSGPLLARVVLNESPPPLPLTNTIITDSEIHTPRISNPRISNPRISNNQIGNPRISNWTPTDPRISNPRISNPRISNESLGEEWQTRDVTYTVTNVGNTTTAYNLQTFIPREYYEDPNFAFQLIIFKTIASVDTGKDASGKCVPVEVLHDEFISSVETPRISNPRISNPDPQSPRISNPRISNAAFYLEPAEGPQAAAAGASFSANALTNAPAGGTGDTSAPVPAPQVHWTMRVFQLAEPEQGEPTIEYLVPDNGPPRIGAVIVSQPRNIVDGEPEKDPPYVCVGTELFGPCAPEEEGGGEVHPIDPPPASASALAFSEQPRDTQAGQTIAPPVQVRVIDANGVTVPITGMEVTMTLVPNPGSATLLGTQLTDSGLATFTDLSISAPGTGYTLAASAPGLTSATSLPFDVTVDRPLVPPLTTRVSVDSTNNQGTGPGTGCAGGRITPDGRYVVFDCTFTNLVPEDTNASRDVFVRDRQTGATTRVSLASNGVEGDKDSLFGSLSDDGRYVAFQSSATNLVTGGDTNGVDDIFVRDLQTGVTRRVSVGPGGAQADGASALPVVSGNGRFVAFWSRATNLVTGDTNGQPDVFVVDLNGPTLATVRVSVQTGGGQTTQAEGTVLPAAPAISADGRFVAFQSSRSNLAPQGVLGQRDIYVHDRQTLTTMRVTVGTDGKHPVLPSGCGPWDSPPGKIACSDFAASNPSISADGRLVTFDSLYSNLVTGDTNYTGPQLGRDVFVYDRKTGQTTRVSVSSDGAQDNTVSSKGTACGVGPSAPALSPDGRFVSFSSCGSSLAAGDTNWIQDVFLHDRLLGTTVRTSVASGGTQVTTASGASGAGFSMPSAGAVVIAMSSDAETMVAGDTNRNTAQSYLGTDIFVHEPIPAAAPAGSRVLAFSAQPAGAFTGEPLSPVIQVELRDAYGNTDLTATDLVTLSVESGPGALEGVSTVNAMAGVATFSGIVLADEGTYTLRASATGLPGALSAPIAAEPAAPAQLAFVTQPTSTHATATMAPAVRVAIQSARGYPVRGNTATVVLSLTSGGAGLLSGSATVDAVDGIATFEDLSVDVVATGYTLVATALSFTATSSPFDVLVSAAPLTFTVTNTSDLGQGSLRQALLAANANTGNRDSITFNIPGAGSHIITPATALPAVNDPVLLDASTQPVYNGVPLVRLDGAQQPSGDGLTIQASNSTVRGLMVTHFPGMGIFLGDASGSTIENSYIGTEGTADLGNGSDGILVSGGEDNVLRNNVVSANHGPGIGLRAARRTTVVGNKVGTNAAGNGVLGNWQGGLRLQDGADGNTIGLSGQGNIVSGNFNTGLRLEDSSNNVVNWNWFGTNAAGASGFGNQIQGLSIHGSSTGNTIGGLGAGEGNVVSGNVVGGIMITGPAHHNTIENNKIGTTPGGNDPLPNGQFGLYLLSGAAGHTLQGNVISGNTGPGLWIWYDMTGTVVRGNYIGTNSAGEAAVPNAESGVRIEGPTTHDHTLQENVISGNTGAGIEILDRAYGVTLTGNKIGTNLNGTSALGNGLAGVSLAGGSHDNVIQGNVVSGNLGWGIDVRGLDSLNQTHHVTVASNTIGTNASGTAAVANRYGGVSVGSLGKPVNSITIGGTAPGARNLISGNGGDGISLEDGSGVVIQGNWIGTDGAGTSAIQNKGSGVGATDTSNLTVGGIVAGAGNLISGNKYDGVGFAHNTHGVLIAGNRIGTDKDGALAVPNGSGISFGSTGAGVTSVDVGGADPGARNIVSGNLAEGIYVWGGIVSGIRIKGNYIGTNEGGTVALPNTGGLRLEGPATVGGASPGEGNLVSGNASYGILIESGASYVAGNRIGTNAASTGALPNTGPGVKLTGSATGNVIGGATASAGNAIAFNTGAGIFDEANDGTANTFQSNSIYSNGFLGIDLAPPGVTPNDLNDLDDGPNGLQNFPVVSSAIVNAGAGTTTVDYSLDSTPATSFVLEFFRSPACDFTGFGEGRTSFGTWTVTTDGTGHAGGSAAFAGTIPLGSYVTATARDLIGNTSEFSACRETAAIVVDTFDPDGTFDPQDGRQVAWAENITPSAIHSATQFTVASGSFRLTSVTLPIAFQGTVAGNLLVSLNADSGGFPGAMLEILSMNESIWPTVTNPFTTKTTLNSVSRPVLSAGASYWIITELTSFPSSGVVTYSWFFNQSGLPSLRVLQELSFTGGLPGGNWPGAMEFLLPVALRVEGTAVP